MSKPWSRIRPRHLLGVAFVAGISLAPGCRPFSYYLSNTTFAISATPGSYVWTQTDANNSQNGTWSSAVTEPILHIMDVQGSNLTIVAIEVKCTYISSQFYAYPTDFGGQVYPVDEEISPGASGSSSLDFTLPDVDSVFGVATNSIPTSPSSTVSAPALLNPGGALGTQGVWEWEAIPLWKNAFNQTNFTGTLDGGNLAITQAAENNDVPSPRANVVMNVQYNLASSAQSGPVGGGGGGGGAGVLAIPARP